MSTEELQELQEHAEDAAQDRSLAPVSLTMAILAVLVAVASLLGHRAHTEEVVLQTRANDEWGYYQGKDVRLHVDQELSALTSFLALSDPAKAAGWRTGNQAETEKYQKQKDDIEARAKELEREAAWERDRADRYDLAEVFLEIGLVVTSITLLSGRRIFWQSGMVLGVIGLAIACTAPFVA
jgi:Domain of unknown function (DUF4337)